MNEIPIIAEETAGASRVSTSGNTSTVKASMVKGVLRLMSGLLLLTILVMAVIALVRSPPGSLR